MKRIVQVTAVFLALASQIAQAGQLLGRVTAADTGAGLYDVTVVATAPPPDKASRPVTLIANTAIDGAYAFLSIPDGNYTFCASHRGDYLNPCVWARALPVAIRGAARTDIALTRGVPIAVHLSDPAGLISDSEKTLTAPQVSVTLIAADGRTILVPRVPVAGPVHEFSLTGPVDTPFQLKISSAKYLLADEAGAAIDERGLAVTLKAAPPADPAAPVTMFTSGPRTYYGALLRYQVRGLTGGAAAGAR